MYKWIKLCSVHVCVVLVLPKTVQLLTAGEICWRKYRDVINYSSCHIAGLTKDAPSTRPSMHSSVNLSAYEDAEWFEVILNFLIDAVTQARHAGYEWCYVTQFGKCYNMCIYHMSNVQGLCSWRSIKTGPDRFSNFMPPGSVDSVLGPVMTNCNEMCHVFCRQPTHTHTPV